MSDFTGNAFSTPAAANFITQGLKAFGANGPETPRLARGVATGLQGWLTSLKVTSTDVGTAGVGAGMGPVIGMTMAVLYGNFLTGFKAAGLSGEFSPDVCKGLALGVANSFNSLVMFQTVHSSVGTGTGVGRIQAPPQVTGAQTILQGLGSAGLVGETVPKLASAVEYGLRTSVLSLVFAIPILGPVSPVSSTGVGFGRVF